MRTSLLACVLAACVEAAPARPDAARDGSATPVACDGGLCATDNGSTCNSAHEDPALLASVLVALAASARRRKR